MKTFIVTIEDMENGSEITRREHTSAHLATETMKKARDHYSLNGESVRIKMKDDNGVTYAEINTDDHED